MPATSPLKTYEIDLKSEAETIAFGSQLAQHLHADDVVALIGPLGAGKTKLVQAIATAFDVPSQFVNSPTFMLIQEYPARIPLKHCDVYRLKSPSEFPELGLDDLFASDSIALIEWADRVTEYLPEDRLEIRLEPTDITARKASLSGYGPRGAELLRQIQIAGGA